MADPADRPVPPSSRRPRWRRWLVRATVALGLVVLLAVGTTAAGLWWVLRTDDGRAWLRVTVEELVNTGGGGLTLRLGALAGDPPGTVVLRDVTLADADGVWLSADRLALAWDPWALLDGHLRVTALSARALWVERPPILPPTPPGTDTATGLDLAPLGRLRVDRLTLEGLSLGAGLTGGEPMLMDGDGRLGPFDGGAGLAARVTLRRIDGRPTDVALRARLDGDTPEQLALDLTARDGPDGTVASVVTLPETVRPLIDDGPLTVTARATLGLADLSLSVDALSVAAGAEGPRIDATAALALDPVPRGTASARVTLPDLGLLAPLLGDLTPTGAADLRLTDVSLTEDGRVTGTLRLTLADAALGLPPADALLGPAPSLGGRLAFDPAAGLTVDDLDLRGAGLSIAGQVALPADMATMTAHLDATLSDLSLVAGDAASGAVVLAADLSGPVIDPAVAVSAQAPEVTLAGQDWADVALEVEAAGLASGPSGRLSLTGTGPGGPVTLSLLPALPGYARAEARDLAITVPGMVLTGGLTMNLETQRTDGTLALRADDLSRLAAWGAPPLSGSLSADITLASDTGGGQRLALRAAAPDLTLPEADVRLGALDVTARVDNALGTPSLTATLTATGGAAAGLAWERLALTAEGGLADLGVSLDLTGTGPTGPLTLAGRARIAPPGLANEGRVSLSALTLASDGHRLRLTAPATLSLPADGGARVDRLTLALDDGTLALTGGMTGAGAFDLSLEGRTLPLALASLAGPEAPALAGRLDLTAALRGALPTPEGTMSLTARDVALVDASELPPLAATLTARLVGGRLGAEARVTGFAAQPARASVDVPLRPGGPALVPEAEPLSARLDWAGPVGAIWDMLPVIDHRLSGDLTLSAELTGTLAAPRVNADARLTGGRYEHLIAGTLLDDLTLTASAADSEKLRLALSGTDGGAGRLSGDGDLRLTPDGPVGAASVRLDNARVVRRDDITATADADLRLTLEGAGAALSGGITSRQVRVRLANLGGGGGAVADLGPVMEIDDPGLSPLAALERAAVTDAGADTGPAAAASAAPFPVSLDVTVRLPNRVFVSGQGLESEWGGALTVGGTAAAPRLDGTIQVRRGAIEVIGKTFTIDTGTIRFGGGPPIDPLVDLVALYKTAGLEARVGVTGPVSDPALVLESVPALPQDEILSRILFGKTRGALTTLETVQLASALAQLSGLTSAGASDIVGVLRQAAGLDVLRVASDPESGAAALEAGTYLGDDVYVGVEQGLEPGSGSVSVEVDLGGGFALESRAAQSGATEVGVQWQRDY